MTTVNLSDILSPCFVDVHKAINDGSVNEVVLKGGRGSAKSSYASVEIILQMMMRPDIHAVVMRRVGNTLRTSVYAQYVWAISALCLQNKFRCTVSPMEITRKATGQKIMFFGDDDAGKLKSVKVPFGYIGIIHFEELDQFAGEEEIRNLEQSALRGGEFSLGIKVFNPPQTAMNWANKYVRTPKPKQIIHHSDYRTTPTEWLGPRFLADAELLRDVNPHAYEHEYLGIANGTGGAVFENVTLRKITDEEIKSLERQYHGIDWGYYPDPFAWNMMGYEAAQMRLFIYDELTLYKTGNEESARKLHEDKNVDFGTHIIADSAEPKSIGDYRAFGYACTGVEKGAGSVDYRHKWLQRLKQIVIDPERCPNTANEFVEYEYERSKDGEIISGYPDKNNHHIDAVSYGMFPVWRRRGK